PSRRGGRADQVMSRYLKVGAAGEVKRPCNKVSALLRCALIKVARHLLIGRNDPSSEEGTTRWFQFIHTFIDRAYSRFAINWTGCTEGEDRSMRERGGRSHTILNSGLAHTCTAMEPQRGKNRFTSAVRTWRRPQARSAESRLLKNFPSRQAS